MPERPQSALALRSEPPSQPVSELPSQPVSELPSAPVSEPKESPSSTSRALARPRPLEPPEDDSAASDVPGTLQWQWPTDGRVAQGYAAGDATRKGLKIAGTLGQPIYAAEAGRVVYSGSGLIGYGALIIIKHNKDFLSAYGYNSKILVKEGDQVTKGEHIAEMGRNGGGPPMLHFEIRRRGKPVDPSEVLPPR